MKSHLEKVARSKHELEEEGKAHEETLVNEARRRRLDFIREKKKMEEKLDADIETNKTRQLGRFKEKRLKMEKELAERESARYVRTV